MPCHGFIIFFIVSLLFICDNEDRKNYRIFAPQTEIMKKRGAIRIILCMVVTILSSLPVVAQEDDVDYRQYKFYDENMERYSSLFDDYLSTTPEAGAVPYITSNAEYAMRSVMNNARWLTLRGAIYGRPHKYRLHNIHDAHVVRHTTHTIPRP